MFSGLDAGADYRQRDIFFKPLKTYQVMKIGAYPRSGPGTHRGMNSSRCPCTFANTQLVGRQRDERALRHAGWSCRIYLREDLLVEICHRAGWP